MKNFDINTLLRENIKNIKPYSSARDEYTGEANIYLDANENPYGSVGGSNYNRYPDPYQRELKKIVSEIKNISTENIFLGVGSDEAIDLIYKAFCYPGKDKVIITSPTYGMYEVSANTNDVGIIDIPLDETFQPKTKEILAYNNSDVKIVFLCSPNNPTANLLDNNKIEEIISGFNGIVIIDEAYIDFADVPSWISKLNQYPNLVVLQTFSKAWGMANIRLGMMFASKEIISIVNKIKLPYNISGMVQDFAINTLKTGKSDKDDLVKKIIKEREKLISEFAKIEIIKHIYPSDANFILIKTENPKQIYNFLLNKMIVVRDRSKITLCKGCLRITVGTSEENNVLIDALKSFK